MVIGSRRIGLNISLTGGRILAMAIADKKSGKNGPKARDQQGRFAEGNGGGPGRPKGKRNKVTAVLRDDILQAYQERGGVAWLRDLPPRDFARLLEKLVPREIAADVKMQANGALSVDYSHLTEQEKFARAQASRIDDSDLTPPGEQVAPASGQSKK